MYGASVAYARKLPFLDPRVRQSRLVPHSIQLPAWSLTEYKRVVFMDLDAWPVADLTPMLRIPMAHDLAAADWSFRL